MLIFDTDINVNTVVKPAMHTCFAKKKGPKRFRLVVSTVFASVSEVALWKTRSHVIVYRFVKIHIILSIIIIFQHIRYRGIDILYL